jgi:hypothetical protein
MTADLDRMRASLAALKMRVSRAVPADRVRMENTAAIIAQAIEAITTSRQALKRMRSGASVEMIFHNDAAAFQSCPEVTQRLIVQAEEQLARNRAAGAQRLKINRIGCKPERNILGLSIFGNTKSCLDYYNFRD